LAILINNANEVWEQVQAVEHPPVKRKALSSNSSNTKINNNNNNDDDDAIELF
jgi:hypothetical protein